MEDVKPRSLPWMFPLGWSHPGGGISSGPEENPYLYAFLSGALDSVSPQKRTPLEQI